MDEFSKALGMKPKVVSNRWDMRKEGGRSKDFGIPGLPDWVGSGLFQGHQMLQKSRTGAVDTNGFSHRSTEFEASVESGKWSADQEREI